MKINDVIQFNENHKWRGCLGIINDIKICGDDIRYTVGVPAPMEGTAFIFVMRSENAIELVGQAILVPVEAKDVTK